MFLKVVVVLSGMLLGYWLIDDFNPAELNGKRVFITGASTGIGEQLAYQFAKYGASVVITARRENKLKEVTEQCRKTGPKEQIYGYVVADMTELDSIETVVETAVQKLGGLDIIVLNHVFYLPLNIWTGSKQNLSSIKHVMTVNFESYIHLASYALPHLNTTNGSITVVNSLTAELNGKRVFITGASTGIGEQLAYQFAKYGASVVITARRENKLKEVTEQCRKTGPKEQIYGYVVADMTELDSIETVVETAVQKLGGLDIIVLNHVFYLPLNFWTGSKQNLSSIKHVMTVNFESYIHLASYALPHLNTTNGSITVVNSLTGKVSTPLTASYSSAKFALSGFFDALRQELMILNSGVSITQCVLGFISTDSSKNLISSAGLKNSERYLMPGTPPDAAEDVLRSTVKRIREIYFPRYYGVLVMLRDWIPGSIDSVFAFLYRLMLGSSIQ